MARVRGLELLFNLVQKQLQSKEDCVIAALHCLMINEGLECVGIGDEWPSSGREPTTELLPNEWNSSQEVYSLRYTTKDKKYRYLLKAVKAGHTLHVNIVKNEDTSAMTSLNVENHISDLYNEYSNAYKDLESLIDTFKRDLFTKITAEPTKISAEPSKGSSSGKSNPKINREGPVSPPAAPERPSPLLMDDRNRGQDAFPQVGGRDLDPFGIGQGGMLMDPSSFGIPSRPTLPEFGIGGPRGLPRGAVPPGARFDPFGPPIRGPNRNYPDPDHYRPPDYDEFM